MHRTTTIEPGRPRIRRGVAIGAALTIAASVVVVTAEPLTTPPTASASTVASTPLRTIAAGTNYSLVVKADGTLWGFGENSAGQRGLAYLWNRQPGLMMSDVASVATGERQSLVVKSDGTLVWIGESLRGQGLPPPTIGQRVISTGVALAAAGIRHYAFVKTDGTLMTFGNNNRGRLGYPPTRSTCRDVVDHQCDVSTPQRVMGGVVNVALGYNHTLALKGDGTLWAFGSNYAGQLGVDIRSPDWNPEGSEEPFGAQHVRPRQVMTDVVDIAASGNTSMVVKSDGTLWAFGRVDELGFTPGNTSGYTPTPILVATNVRSVALSRSDAGEGDKYTLSALYLDGTGTAWAVGSNASGQLGDPASAFTADPLDPFPVMTDVVQMAVGFNHSLFVKSDGSVWSVGANGAGQLGSILNTVIPTPVLDSVSAVSAGRDHSLVRRSDGSLWAFGSNQYGQLGTTANAGTTTPNPTPVKVLDAVGSFAAGGDFSVAVNAGGQAIQWGRGTDPTDPTVYVTTPVVKLDNVTQVAAGDRHVLALKSDGTVWAWGRSDAGQAGWVPGVGASDYDPVPRQVMSNVTQIAAGPDFSLAIMTDKSLWGFGQDSCGQTGQTPRPTLPAPWPYGHRIGCRRVVPIINGMSVTGVDVSCEQPVVPLDGVPRQFLTDVTDIAAGAQFTVARRSNGTVWSFGCDASQMGGAWSTWTGGPGGPVLPHDYALAPTPSKAITRVAAGDRASVFIDSDGVLWGLGTSATAGFTVPDAYCLNFGYPGFTAMCGTAIVYPHPLLDGVAAADGGGGHTLVLRNDGSLWSAGTNTYGQLGRSDEPQTGQIVASQNVGGQQRMGFVTRPVRANITGATGLRRVTPDTPAIASATPTDRRITLTWTTPTWPGTSPITDYILQRSTNGRTWTTITDGTNTRTTYTITSLTNGTTYQLRIAAKNKRGQSLWSATTTATPLGPPSTPRTLTATTTGQPTGTLKLTWLAPTSTGGTPITDYIIQTSPNGRTWTTINDGISTLTTHTLTGLTPRRSIRIRIAATNTAGTSPYTSSRTATPR